MREHPIPQDITGYRFHIIGSMTLKQFGEILLGVIIAVILYKTNLVGFIKWPLIGLSFGMGLAAAFLPIEERPLDHWLITFFSILYKPTKFYWRRKPHVPDAFTYESAIKENKEITLDLTPAKRQRIKEYVGSIPEKNELMQDFTKEEIDRMRNILSSFTDTTVQNIAPAQVKPVAEKPRMDVRVRKMKKPVQHDAVIFDDMSDIFIHNQDADTQEKIRQRKKVKKSTLATDQVAHDVQIEELEDIRTVSEAEREEKTNDIEAQVTDTSEKTFIEPTAVSAPAIATGEASYNADLPFPVKPTKPNVVVGMVLSQNNELLTNAIVEIQTEEGNIARAVKTNALGQFHITTPLKKGDYNVVVEKPGYQFQPKHLLINDTIILPMEIRSEN